MKKARIDAPETCQPGGGKSTVLLETGLMLNDGVSGSWIARNFEGWECVVKDGQVKKLKSLPDGA